MVEVLIATDSGYLGNLLGELVAPEHDVVGTVANGVELVESCKEGRPDVVLADAAMPITDGVEATAELSEAHDDVAVVVCTSDADRETRRAAFDAGAAAVLTTPFVRTVVLEAVADAATA